MLGYLEAGEQASANIGQDKRLKLMPWVAKLSHNTKRSLCPAWSRYELIWALNEFYIAKLSSALSISKSFPLYGAAFPSTAVQKFAINFAAIALF